MANTSYSIKTVITGTTEIKSIQILYLNLSFEVFQTEECTMLTYKDWLTKKEGPLMKGLFWKKSPETRIQPAGLTLKIIHRMLKEEKAEGFLKEKELNQ